MRNRALHDALREFALEAAARLVRANEAGAELRFSLDEGHNGSATLYRYRPLTAEFIADRWDELCELRSFEPAARALGTGARAYLRRRGEPGADAEPALRAMLERLYEDATAFTFPEERFEHVYAGVERALYAGTVHALVAAPVLGLCLEGARVELGGDLALVDPALVTPAPSPAWLEGEEGGAAVGAYLVLERDLPSDASLPLSEARIRFSCVVTALRLLERGGVTLAPLGFSRVGEGRWQPFRLARSADGRGSERTLASEDAEELRELTDALEDGPRPGLLGWALGRFEMGMERESETEALSDYLLALRALLDGGRGAEPSTVALRLAALCAGEEDRRAVQGRIESAFALEPFVVEGGLGAARGERYVEAVGRHGPQALVRELEEALRHLIGGVLRQEIDADLAGLADEILLRTGEPLEIRARRVEREEPKEPHFEKEPEEEPALEEDLPAHEPAEGQSRVLSFERRNEAPPVARRPEPSPQDELDLGDESELYSAPV